MIHLCIQEPKGKLILAPSTMAKFTKWEEYAKGQGIELRPFSGYRNKAHQEKLWDKKMDELEKVQLTQKDVDKCFPGKGKLLENLTDDEDKKVREKMAAKWVARPGTSNHQKGTTLDMKAYDITKNPPVKVQKFLAKTAPLFGFRLPMSWEPWHCEDKNSENLPRIDIDYDDVISNSEYVVMQEEEQKKKEEQQMLASKPGLIEEGGNDIFGEEVSKFPGQKWAGRLSGNGGNDVAVLVPPHFDPSKPAEIIYHFHGLHGDLPYWTEKYIDNPSSAAYTTNNLHADRGKVHAGKDRLNQAAQQIVARTNKNAILVYPLRGVKPGAWMSPVATKEKEDMGRLHAEVLDVMKTKMKLDVNVGQIIGQGHSAGGQPLRNAAKSGFAFNKLVFLDATYGNWGRDTYNAMVKNDLFDQCEELQIVYIPKSPTAKDAFVVQRLADRDGNDKVKMVASHYSKTKRHQTMNTYYFAGDYDPNPKYEYYDSSRSSFT